MNRHQSESCGRHGMTQRIGRAALGGVVLAIWLLGGCSHGTTQSTVAAAVEIPAGSFAAQWKVDLPMRGTTLKQLYLNDNVVFACRSDNQCFWVNRKSGHTMTLADATTATDTLFAPITLADRVVFPSTSQLSVFSPEGRLAHRIPLQYSASSSGVGDGRHVFIGVDHENGGRLTAVDTKEQPYEIAPWWELMTRGQLSAKPAVLAHELFAGSRDGRVYAVRADNRAVVWQNLATGYFRTGGEILADLKAEKDGVYVASMDTKLYCLKLDTGKISWVYHAGRPLRERSSPVVTADTVYLYVPELGVAAIDKTGKKEVRTHRWVVAEGQQILAYDEKCVFLRNQENQILAVDKQSGEIKYRSKRKDFVCFVTNESDKDNTIYAATAAGELYAIRPVPNAGAVGEWVFNAQPTTPLAAAK